MAAVRAPASRSPWAKQKAETAAHLIELRRYIDEALVHKEEYPCLQCKAWVQPFFDYEQVASGGFAMTNQIGVTLIKQNVSIRERVRCRQCGKFLDVPGAVIATRCGEEWRASQDRFHDFERRERRWEQLNHLAKTRPYLAAVCRHWQGIAWTGGIAGTLGVLLYVAHVSSVQREREQQQFLLSEQGRAKQEIQEQEEKKALKDQKKIDEKKRRELAAVGQQQAAQVRERLRVEQMRIDREKQREQEDASVKLREPAQALLEKAFSPGRIVYSLVDVSMVTDTGVQRIPRGSAVAVVSKTDENSFRVTFENHELTLRRDQLTPDELLAMQLRNQAR